MAPKAIRFTKAEVEDLDTLQGGFAGYGWEWRGRRREEVADEQVVIRKARALKDSGLHTGRVAKELNRLGYRTREGKEWTREKAYNQLFRPNRL